MSQQSDRLDRRGNASASTRSARRARATRRAAWGTDAFAPLEERRLFALTVTPYAPTTAISTLTGALVQPNTGITVTGASYVGVTGQGGTYSGFSFNDGKTALSLGNGVLLTSGLAKNALGPNNQTGITGTDNGPGDADLTALIGGTATHDANALTIDFTTTAATKSIAFNFVFGSDEFPEFVGQFNDAFGAYLDGKQISVDTNNKPVTVSNNFFTLNNTNPSITGTTVTAGKTVVSFNLQYDGLTPALTTKGTLGTGVTAHTLKFVIADAGDTSVDSGVFISGLRGDDTTGTGTGQPPVAKAGGPYTVVQGGTVKLNGTGSTDPNQTSASLKYAWDLDGDGVFGETGAAAANGNETSSTPTFVAGSLPVGTVKTVALKVTDNTGLTSTVTTTVTVTSPVVTNKPPVAKNDTVNTPKGTAVTIDELANDSDPNAGGSLVPSTVKIGTGPSNGAVSVDPTTGKITYTPDASFTGADTFTYTVKDKLGLTSNVATVTVNVIPPSTGGTTIVSHGWQITYPAGVAIVVDPAPTLVLEKFAAFTSSSPLDITFTQVGYDASPTITITDESVTNVSGTVFDGLSLSTVTTAAGNAGPAVFAPGKSFVLGTPESVFTTQTDAPTDITLGGTLGSLKTAKLGFGLNGAVVINANPAKSGAFKTFSFDETPVTTVTPFAKPKATTFVVSNATAATAPGEKPKTGSTLWQVLA